MVLLVLDALRIARDNPTRPVVFLGVGFETTGAHGGRHDSPAEAEGVGNFSVLSLHKLTPPATSAILCAGDLALDGIIGPGHVTTIIGADAWEFLPSEYQVPVAVAGFEPLDILRSVADLVDMIEDQNPAVANSYSRTVTRQGNPSALAVMDRVFETDAADLARIGNRAGQRPENSEELSHLDAGRIFEPDPGPVREHRGCRCGECCAAHYSQPNARSLAQRARLPGRPVPAWFRPKGHAQPTTNSHRISHERQPSPPGARLSAS